MFDRYNVIDQLDLSRAVTRRFGTLPSDNGKETADKPLEGVEVK
jgi:hypothetical protein